MAKKIYKSMQGKLVDMDKLKITNETTVAVTGNSIKMNARGDRLGPGGKIIKKREDIVAEYYENNPKVIPPKQITQPDNTTPSTTPNQNKTNSTRIKK